MADSILTTTKRTLGLAEDYTAFDQEIIMHINSVFGTLNQLGLGPTEGYEIVDATSEWSEFLPPLASDPTKSDPRYNPVKSYMYLRLRLLWDPPQVGYVLTAFERQQEQLEWRLQVLADPNYVPPTTTDTYDWFGDPITP